MADRAHYGLIEAGGTKFVLGIAACEPAGPQPTTARETIIARHQIPTTTPAETLDAALRWLTAEFAALGVNPAAIGIGSFGPLDLTRSSPTWGHITRTPKPHWAHTDLVTPFASAFNCPVAINTDVNGAALAEARWGAGQGHNSLLYLTVGTGIGGGFVSDGALLHGLSHPEMGHMLLPRHPDDLAYPGACPFHGACLEGLAAGPSVIARWGKSLSQLPADHPGAGIIAWYLARAVTNFQAILEPARIVLGGGVMGTPGLLDRVRAEAVISGAGYFAGNPAELVVSPTLGGDSGLLGALALALSV
jgi:fructokinase